MAISIVVAQLARDCFASLAMTPRTAATRDLHRSPYCAGQRTKPSSSSFAQAITCLIDWPLCSFASIGRIDAALVDLHGDVGRRREAGGVRLAMMLGPHRVVEHRALRRLDILPHLEVQHAGIGRDVVARPPPRSAAPPARAPSGARSVPSPRSCSARTARCPRTTARTARTGPSVPSAPRTSSSPPPPAGASRFATAQAEGGFQISALLPEISARLFDASS